MGEGNKNGNKSGNKSDIREETSGNIAETNSLRNMMKHFKKAPKHFT
jgi:glycerol-3-phosphate acyltransferase PlsY